MNIRLIESYLDDYLTYYTFVKKQSQIKIFSFSSFINDPELAMDSLSKLLEIRKNEKDLKYEIEKISQLFKGATDPLGASTPSAFKESQKAVIKDYLQNLDAFQDAELLFQSLSNKSVV